MRISTLSPSGRINATPLWFAWHGGKIWTYCRGRKVDNLRANPQCTLLVDRAVRFAELQGIMIQGQAQIIEDAAAEAADPELAAVRDLMGRKYHGGHGEPSSSEPGPFAASARPQLAMGEDRPHPHRHLGQHQDPGALTARSRRKSHPTLRGASPRSAVLVCRKPTPKPLSAG
jgi:hypothetical protein